VLWLATMNTELEAKAAITCSRELKVTTNPLALQELDCVSHSPASWIMYIYCEVSNVSCTRIHKECFHFCILECIPIIIMLKIIPFTQQFTVTLLTAYTEGYLYSNFNVIRFSQWWAWRENMVFRFIMQCSSEIGWCFGGTHHLTAYYLFLLGFWLTLWPWRWRWYVHLKCWAFSKLYKL
jgi:hypothetical protein